MGKTFFITILLLIQFSANLATLCGEVLPDGAEILRPLYQDEKQRYFEVRIKPPGKPSDYDWKAYYNSVQFLVYHLDKESNLYSQFLPYKLIGNIPSIRTKEVDSKPLQHALFQGPDGLIFVELAYAKDEWKPLMNLPREFDDTLRWSWDIQYTTNPSLFVYSRATDRQDHNNPHLFELGVIDVDLDEIRILVPHIVRQNDVTSSLSTSMPFVVFQDQYVLYPIVTNPWKLDEYNTYSTAYDSLKLRTIASQDEIELATHDLMLRCELGLQGGELHFYDLNLGNVEDLVKRVRAKGEEERF